MAKKDPPRAVIFDLGQVLIRYDSRRIARRLSERCRVPAVRIMAHFLNSRLEKKYTRGEIKCRDFFRSVSSSLKLDVDFDYFRSCWNGIFWENEGMEELLEDLKTRYPLYLISNTNHMHFEYIRKNFTVLKHFRRVFASHKVGARKPEPEIYRKVLRVIRMKPEETVFIDDCMEFVRGARKVGMRAIRFRNREQLIRDLRKIGVKI